MPFSPRHVPARNEPALLAVSEAWIVLQAALLIVGASWALGSTRSWAQDWLVAVVGLGLLPMVLRLWETREFRMRPVLPALLWVGFATIAMLNPSHVPGPGGEWMPRVGWVSWLPTTVDRAHTLADARLWLAALVEGALLSALLRHAGAARILWRVIALNGFALAIVGAWFHFAGADRLLDVIEAPEPTYFFATFFYKNHWAAYGALSAVVALALALQAWPAALAGHPAARGQTLLFGGAGLLTAITLPLPGSRAGAFLATAIVGGFLLLMFLRRGSISAGSRIRRGWTAAAGVTVVAGVLAFGAIAYAPRSRIDLERTRRQFEQRTAGDALDLRVPLSRDTWHMAQPRPWFGWGPGCFEIVFPLFQGDYLRGADGKSQVRFEAAHNDWLQLLAECGAVGALLLLVPAAVAGRRAWRRSDRAGRFAVIGCGLIAVYASIDFPFHNPAVLMLWTVILTTVRRLNLTLEGNNFTDRRR